MHIDDRQQNPFSPQLRLPLPPSHQFGEAVAAPKGLALFEHFHPPKQPDPATAVRFIIGAATNLDVKDLNPGFISSTDALITDTGGTGLQTCLHMLITAQFQNFLGSKQNKAPSGSDRLRVALVDLCGNKTTQSDFAGWGSPVAMYGASVPKILALYAAQQLRKDLRNLASAQSITNGRTLETTAIQNWKLKGLKNDFPDLVWLFDSRKWSGASDLDFTTPASDTFSSIAENCPAGELRARVGFPYIGSLTWQSGLRHPARGGLWLGSAYCKKGSWSDNPIPPVSSNSVTALSADAHRLPSHVQVYEVAVPQKFDALAAAIFGNAESSGRLQRLTHDVVMHLQLGPLLPAPLRIPRQAERESGVVPPGERLFCLQLAGDPTAEENPEPPAAATRAPILHPALKTSTPERFLKPWEYQISRKEAFYDLSSVSTFMGALGGTLRRLVHCLAFRREFRKWQVLLNGKSPDEQLWSVRPPRGGLTHRFILAWARNALQLAGYDPRNMLTEWHIFWRRKGV